MRAGLFLIIVSLIILVSGEVASCVVSQFRLTWQQFWSLLHQTTCIITKFVQKVLKWIFVLFFLIHFVYDFFLNYVCYHLTWSFLLILKALFFTILNKSNLNSLIFLVNKLKIRLVKNIREILLFSLQSLSFQYTLHKLILNLLFSFGTVLLLWVYETYLVLFWYFFHVKKSLLGNDFIFVRKQYRTR